MGKPYRLAKGTDIFECRFQRNKQTYQFSLGMTDERKAKLAAEKAVVLAKEGRSPAEVKAIILNPNAVIQPVRQRSANGEYTVAEAIGSYIKARELRMNDPKGDKRWNEEQGYFRWMIDGTKVVNGSRVQVTPVEQVIGHDLLITELDVAVLRRLVAARKAIRKPNGKPPAGATVNKETWQLLKRAYMHASTSLELSLKRIDWNDRDIKQKEAGPIRREVSASIDLKFENAKDKFGHSRFRDGYADLFRFGCMAGFRISNLAIRWEQVDDDNREITIVQKGERDHTIQIDDDMWSLIERQRGNHPEFVFTYVQQRTRKNQKNGAAEVRGTRAPVTESGFRSWLARTTKALGIKLTPHDLRRTAGTRILRATGNLKAASAHLGHSTVAITAALYTHVTADDQRATLNEAARVFKEKKERAIAEAAEREERAKEASTEVVSGERTSAEQAKVGGKVGGSKRRAA